MGKRTSLEEQAAAVARLAAKNNDPALRDAVNTLASIRKIGETLRSEHPDEDRAVALLVALVTGS